MDCLGAVSKAQVVSRRTFGLFQWCYFLALDLLAYVLKTFKARQFSEIRELSEEMIEAQEIYIERKDKIEQFAKENFKMISNVDHLDEAEVICFGETHWNNRHMRNHALLIDALCEQDDLILLEYDEKYGKREPDAASYVQQSLTKMGWDKRDPSADATDKIGLRLNQELSLPTLIRRILDRVFPRLAKLEEKERDYLQKVFDELPERNRRLCKTIEENQKKDRRIYAIVGSSHLRPSKEKKNDGINREPQTQAFNETLAYLQTKKYAILIHN